MTAPRGTGEQDADAADRRADDAAGRGGLLQESSTAPRARALTPATAHGESSCDLCGGPMREAHCKLICDRCGYTRDCSDP